jgi:hypothetical protein
MRPYRAHILQQPAIKARKPACSARLIWTFLISVFNLFSFFVILFATIVRSFLSLNATLDAFIGMLLNLPAVAFWVSWLARSSGTSLMTNAEIGSTLALYVFGGLGVGWILGALIRRVLIRLLVSIG